MFTVKQVAARNLVGFHWIGPWEETVPRGFESLSRWTRDHQLQGEKLAVYYDDPDQVPADRLRCDTAIAVGDNFVLPAGSEGARLITLPGGLYAVGLAEIENNAFFEAWEQLFDQVEADARYRLTGKPCYERYLHEGEQSGIWVLEMLIPVTQIQES
ncbi:DNA gyrase inhibitor SbmC [Citrobacter sp. JGM124]|uniref:DNA gyrase inhibitor SbmC n=1 Tax=Citrobacter sp. JGM124 TaxID=2799789 RepID=UPI001BA50F6E|nr:DNA gyrase inhibitor SbmC [Citrobacter sp. JGM124]MBS0847983.1 DNA gyrase inhibitor SbmC [Citrobacter sp. JGM124]